MAAFLEQLQADLIVSIKARDKMRSGVLRMILARIKEKQVEPGAELPLTDDVLHLQGDENVSTARRVDTST